MKHRNKALPILSLSPYRQVAKPPDNNELVQVDLAAASQKRAKDRASMSLCLKAFALHLGMKPETLPVLKGTAECFFESCFEYNRQIRTDSFLCFNEQTRAMDGTSIRYIMNKNTTLKNRFFQSEKPKATNWQQEKTPQKQPPSAVGLLKTIALAILLWMLPGIANAQFSSLTNEARVNTTTAGEQWDYWWSIRTIAVQPDGGYIIVWIDDNGLDGQGQGIFGQRFDASGAKVGPEFLVNTITSGDQFSPTIAVAPDGSFIVGWEGPGNGTDVFAQRFDKNGVKVGTEFLLSTTVGGSQNYPEIQFFPDGTYVAAFVDGGQTVLQKFGADDRSRGVETRIISGTGDAVVMDALNVMPDGRVLQAWTSGNDVYAQLFDSNLQPIGVQTRLNSYITDVQRYVVVRVDGVGNIWAVWESNGQDGSGYGAYVRRFDSNLNPYGPEIVVSTSTANNQYGLTLAVAPNGRTIIAWGDNNNRDGGGTAGGDSGTSVWIREFDTNGNPVGVETMVNQSTAGYQDWPVIDMNASGRFVVGWEGNGTQTGQIDNYGVFARAYQLSQTGTTTMFVPPAAMVASDLVTVTMTLTAPTNIANVKPNPPSVSGTNGVFATLVNGPTPATATVGTTPVEFTWTYQVTAQDDRGALTFGGNATAANGAIFPYATSNYITVSPALYLSDLTAPNLVNDSNNPDSGPQVFTIGAKITNAGLSKLTDVELYLGDGVTPGVFPVTTMTLAQTNNTYQGSFALEPMAGIADCTRDMITMGPSKTVIGGKIDMNGDGLVNDQDNGVLSNGMTVINGFIDVNKSGTISSADDKALPPGLFYGYREPAIIDGLVDTNRDGVISALDNGTFGGETFNVYWQVRYHVKDAFGKATFGNCNDLVDDLRYQWVIWGTGKDADGIVRMDRVDEFAKVRCEISASANRISPNPGGYITGGPPRVIDGLVDVNMDGNITTADVGTYFGKPVIAGKVDMDNSGTITTADDGVLNGFPVIDGFIDINKDGSISALDNGILIQTGQTFTLTVNNATFGNIGAGFDENRDNLWDIDVWHQPVGKTNWPTGSFRLIDIQSDVTGSGGSNPLNGVTTHYDNEPYLSRMIGDLYGSFDATYTYTFLAMAPGDGFLTPYQEAASGSNNEKYNGDFGVGVNVLTGLPGLTINKTGSPGNVLTCGTVTWSMNYQNISNTKAGDPGSGNGVVIEDILPANTTFVAGSATCGGYPCTVYYSTDQGSTWTTFAPPAANVNGLRWHIDKAVPPNSTGTVSFQTSIKNCPANGSIVDNQANIRLGSGVIIGTAGASVSVQNSVPVIATCAITRTITGCGTDAITGPAFSTIPTLTSEAVFENTTNLGNVSDDCGITSVTYSDQVSGTCPVVTRTWVLADACGNTATCAQTIHVVDNTNPVISCLPDQIRPGVCGYPVAGTEFDPPSVSDNCGINNLTYSLSGATSGSGINTLSGVFFNMGVTTISWAATDHCNRTSSCSFTVTVVNHLNPNLTASHTICSGTSTTLTAAATGGTAPYTYAWSNGLGSGASKTVTPGSSTTYTVTVTDNNGCTATGQSTVSVSITPSANAGLNHTICRYFSTTLTATATGGTAPYIFNWSNGLGTGAAKTVNPLTTTTYTVTVTSANGCHSTSQVMVTVQSCPEVCGNGLDDDGDGQADCADSDCGPSVSLNPSHTICSNHSTTLTASGSGGNGALTYQWSHGLGTGPSKTVTPSSTTTYSVTVTAALSLCTSVAQVTVTVSPCPENCTNGIDDDNDGLVDCDDPDCLGITAPVLNDDEYTTCPALPFSERVTYNDGNLLGPVFSIYSQPANGMVSIDGTGKFHFIPFGNECTSDVFIYQVCNSQTGCCDIATVTIHFGDTTPPVLTNVPADITISCDDAIPMPGLITAFDQCPGIYIEFEETSGLSDAGACETYNITRTWKAMDLCGNLAVAQQNINVSDLTKPEIFRVYTLGNGSKLIAGVTKRVTHDWKYVPYPITFGHVPVIFTQINSADDFTAVNVRQRNISTQGFEMRLQEEQAADGKHGPESVAWIAIEPGIQGGAFAFEAGTLANVNHVLQTLNFTQSFSEIPVLISSIQSTNDNDPVNLRHASVSSTGMQMYLQEETSGDAETAHLNETIGFIAVQPGSAIIDKKDQEFGEAGTLSLTNAWTQVLLNLKYTKPVVVFGGVSQSDPSPVNVRVRNVTSSSFEVRLQEWDYLDGNHGVETVSWLVVEGSIPGDNGYYCSGTASDLQPGVNVFAVDNCDELVAFGYNEVQSFGSTGTLTTRNWTAVDDCGNLSLVTRYDTCMVAAVKIKTMLNGAAIGNGNAIGLMRDDLRKKDLVPKKEPFSKMPSFSHVVDKTPGYGNGNGNNLITICHNPGKSSQKTKLVNESSLAAHLAHGDVMGACSGGSMEELAPGAMASTYRTIANGDWTSAATWAGGLVPPTGDIKNISISIEHDVVIQSASIRLENKAQLWVSNGSLTFNSGNFVIDKATAVFEHSSLSLPSSAGDVQIADKDGELIMYNSEINIGQHFQNLVGRRWLENVCMTVGGQYSANLLSSDTLINVNGVIGQGWINDTGGSMYLEEAKIKVQNGNFENKAGAYLNGEGVVLLIENGHLSNLGYWTAAITQYCVSNLVTVPLGFLPASEGCANIAGNFDVAVCSLSELEPEVTTEENTEYIPTNNGGILEPALLDVEGEKAVVDWVLVELRNAADEKDIKAYTTAVLDRDGEVFSEIGDSVLVFPEVPEGDYYVAIRHRNHLGIMTDVPFFLSTKNVPEIDFTDPGLPVRGGQGAGRIQNGKRSLWGGDLNGDGKVIYQGPFNDVFALFSRVLSENGNSSYLANYIVQGYESADMNLDGRVIYQGPNNDRASLLYHTVLSHGNNNSLLANFIVKELLP